MHRIPEHFVNHQETTSLVEIVRKTSRRIKNTILSERFDHNRSPNGYQEKQQATFEHKRKNKSLTLEIELSHTVPDPYLRNVHFRFYSQDRGFTEEGNERYVGKILFSVDSKTREVTANKIEVESDFQEQGYASFMERYMKHWLIHSGFSGYDICARFDLLVEGEEAKQVKASERMFRKVFPGSKRDKTYSRSFKDLRSKV